jgi:hypothetical protein
LVELALKPADLPVQRRNLLREALDVRRRRQVDQVQDPPGAALDRALDRPAGPQRDRQGVVEDVGANGLLRRLGGAALHRVEGLPPQGLRTGHERTLTDPHTIPHVPMAIVPFEQPDLFVDEVRAFMAQVR